MDVATRNFLLLKLAETLGVIAVIMIAGTSQRLKYKPVQFKYPQREGRASITVFILILAATVIFYFTPVGKNILSNGSDRSLVGQFIIALVCLVIAAVALFYRHQPLLSAGWGAKPNLKLGLRIGVMLVFLVIFLRGKVMSIVDGVTASEGIALLLLLGICLAEETIFRGYLQLRITSWLGKPVGWLVTSALFVIWQLPRLLASPADLWLNLTVIIIQSLLLGWLMQKTGHVIAPALYRTISDWLTILN